MEDQGLTPRRQARYSSSTIMVYQCPNYQFPSPCTAMTLNYLPFDRQARFMRQLGGAPALGTAQEGFRHLDGQLPTQMVVPGQSPVPSSSSSV